GGALFWYSGEHISLRGPVGGVARGAADTGSPQRKDRLMKRFSAIAFAGVFALCVFAIPVGKAGAAGAAGKMALKGSLCTSAYSPCAESFDEINGKYVGHDEPSLEFKSNVPGSGNDMTYTMTLPTDPSVQPNASGAGGTTWNFELRPTFWFGVTLCDNQS